MKMTERQEYLIDNFIEESLSQDEADELKALMQENEEFEKAVYEIGMVAASIEAMQEAINEQREKVPEKKKIISEPLRIAAGILILIGTVLLTWYLSRSNLKADNFAGIDNEKLLQIEEHINKNNDSLSIIGLHEKVPLAMSGEENLYVKAYNNFQEAMVLWEKDNYDEGRVLFNEAAIQLEKYGMSEKDIESLEYAAISYMYSGYNDKAISLFENLVLRYQKDKSGRQASRNIKVHLYLTELYLKKREFEQAKMSFAIVLKNEKMLYRKYPNLTEKEKRIKEFIDVFRPLLQQ